MQKIQAKKPPSPELSRRAFMLVVGAGSAATAACVALRTSGNPPATAPRKREKRGYRVSEHIDRYYRTASV